MRRALAIATVLAAATGVGLSATPAPACACGVALRADIARERVLVIEKDGREEIIASFDLRGDGTGRAAIVLPVPGTPQVEAIEEGDPLAYLDQATAPPVQTAGAPSGGGDDTARAPVDVIGREVVGGYDVTRLRAGDPKALDEWLKTNGYTLPDGARPILSDYIDESWRLRRRTAGSSRCGSRSQPSGRCTRCASHSSGRTRCR